MEQQPFIFVLVLVLVICVCIVQAYLSQKRRKELAAWAAAHGLSFDSGKASNVDDYFHFFKCLQEGDNRYAYNMTRGEWAGHEYFGFDYHYEKESTDSKGHTTTTNYYFSAVILACVVPLQPLFIRPEGFFDKIAEFFGYDDIDFESAEFSRKFCVKADDRRWAYDVLHARTIEFLLASPFFSMQFDTHHVIAWRNGTFHPDEFAASADVIAGILGRLPEYVIKQQTGAE